MTEKFGVKFIKSLLVGVIFCVAAILLFAFILKFFDLPEAAIRWINQGIKLVAVVLSCLVGVSGEKGWLKGGAIGVAVVVVTYLLFGLISGSISFGVAAVAEVAFGILTGILAGIIAVNLKK